MINIWAILKTCMKDKFFITGGRAGRAEFWTYTIFHLCIVRVIIYFTTEFNQLTNLIGFIFFIAQYTVLLRRLHDTNRSGQNLFILMAGLLTILTGFMMANQQIIFAGKILTGIGSVYLLLLCLRKGTVGDNRFGPQPEDFRTEKKS